MTTEALTLVVILLIGRTEGSREVEVLGEGIAVVGHEVHILLLEVAVIGRVVPEGLSEDARGRGVELHLTLRIGIVQTDTTREVDLLVQLILQRAEEHIAVVGLGVEVAVSDPVGVLHVHTHATGGPLLDVVSQLCIIALEVLLLIEVLTTWIEVSTYDGVEVSPVGDHVVGIVTDIASRDIQGELVVEELARVAYRGIVAVVLVVGDDPLSVDRRGREVSLVLVRPYREVEGVIERHPTVVEVTYLVVRGSSELVPPRGVLPSGITIGILELRQDEGASCLDSAGEVHTELARSTLLGIDEDNPVSSRSTIERSSRGAGEDADRLDVVGVDAGDPFSRGTARAEARAVTATVGAIADGHPVDHIEDVVIPRDGLVTTHDDTGSTTYAGGATLDVHPSDLTIEAVHEVGVLDRRQGVILDLLYIIA